MTLSEIRAAALADAKRKAFEIAETDIQSKTKVEVFFVAYKVIWPQAEGAVSAPQQKDKDIKTGKN